MANELDNACDAIQETLAAHVDGLKSTPQHTPGRVSRFPVLLVSPATGTWSKQSSALVRAMHGIRVGCYVPLNDMEKDIAWIRPFGERIKDVLLSDDYSFMTDTSGNLTIDHITGDVSYTFGPVDLGATTVIGWTIEFEVKIRSSETNGVYSTITG